MTGKEAKQAINDKIKQVEALIDECESLSEEHSIEFSLHTSYGMGGTYVPARKQLTRAEALNLIEKGDELSPDLLSEIQYVLKYAKNEEEFAERWSSSGETGWMASSQSC